MAVLARPDDPFAATGRCRDNMILPIFLQHFS